MNYQVPKIEWIDQNKLDENKVETENWHRSIAETLIHRYQVLESMTQDNKIMVHYYNKQTQKGEPYVSCPNFNDVGEAKEWVEQTHYPTALLKAGFKPISEPVADTLKWFELAVPKPTLKSQMVQIGCHFEEVAEMMVELGNRHESLEIDNLADYYKNLFTDSEHIEPLSLEKDIELLDSLCDQIVTALGVGYMFGFDMKLALAEVVRSNFSKFENGKPVFDENGKIKKGKDYTSPQLEGFI